MYANERVNENVAGIYFIYSHVKSQDWFAVSAIISCRSRTNWDKMEVYKGCSR